MNDGSVSMMDRLRASLASLLSGLASGARRLEHWSARGTRPVVLGLVAIAVLAFGALAIVSVGHAFGAFMPHDPRVEHGRAWQGPPPAPKPVGKPEDRRGGGFWGRPEGKPEAPRPPAPP